MNTSAQELQAAFQEFTSLSERLTSSYNELQDKITRLTDELEEAKRQRAEQVEQKQQVAEKLEHLLFLLPVGVVVIDSQGCVSSANPTAHDLLGEALEGCAWVDVIERCFAPRQGDGYEISLKDGRLVSIATRSLEREPGQMIVINDMTETRRLQEQVSRSERLTEMGRMVASLAHQIRTPLSTAMLYAGHLQSEDLSLPNRQKFAGKLLGRLKNLEQQIGDMLRFARGGNSVAEPFDVGQLVVAVEQAIDGLSSDQVQVHVCPLNDPLGSAAIIGHVESLTGAVMNLVNNALQAGASRIDVEFSMNADELLVAVKDNGPGIESALLDKILEPFYTTKSQGTGLGLAIVQSVVSAHKGRLQVRSESGQGAEFCLMLPAMPAA